MHSSRTKIVAYLQAVWAYRRLTNFVWRSSSGYVFRCATREALQSALAELPVERLTL